MDVAIAPNVPATAQTGLDPADGGEALSHSDLLIDITPVERILARTPVVGVGEYKCRRDHPQFRGGGPETCPYIVFSRSSVRLAPNRGPAEICTPVAVNLLDVGDSYERKAVGEAGADCDWIAVSPKLLREIARLCSADAYERSGSVFERCIAPISAKTYFAQRIFFSAIRRFPHTEPMAIEEAAIRLVALALIESTPTEKLDAEHSRANSRKNSSRVREIVESTKAILAQEYSNNPSVADIAARVHCSPAYLSRVFSWKTGVTLHRYQQQIRLRISLELLAEGRFNGAGIAAQLGFASHSHFAEVFRRCFGITPGSFAQTVSSSSLRTMLRSFDRKNVADPHRAAWARCANPVRSALTIP